MRPLDEHFEVMCRQGRNGPGGGVDQGSRSSSAEDKRPCGAIEAAAWNFNRRTNNGTVSTFICDNKNEVTNALSGTFTYDANGNPTYFNASGSKNFGYDDENRLTSVSMVNTWRSDFVYDGLGRMRTRSEYTWNGSSWVLSTTTYYVYDGMRVLQERNSGNTPTVAYTRGIDLSGSFEGAGGIGGLLARSHGYSSGNWTAHNFYHADGNGNITYLVDSSQALAASYRYDPFGNTISSSGTLSSTNVYRFSSKEIHVTSGMYYYLYRFYDPNLQRWINRDPIEEEGGLNLYSYIRNSPIDLVDLWGWAVGSGRKIFPEHPGSLDKNRSQVSNTSGNAPPACPAPVPPSSRCSNPGDIRNVQRDGTETKDCPGWGTITVPCFKYEECSPYYEGSLKGVKQNGNTWQKKRNCECPKFPQAI